MRFDLQTKLNRIGAALDDCIFIERNPMLDTLKKILEMIRFSHTVFALPFAMLAAVMAWTSPGGQGFRWSHLVGILLCMVTARSAAMAFNRIADRKIDAGNPRTRGRHIPAGILSLGSVVVFTVVTSAAFIASTLLFLPNRLPIILSLPVLLFLFIYSYTKRFTSLAHFYLGASLMLAPVSTWIALRGDVMLGGGDVPANFGDITPAALLGVAVLLWVAGFDMIYACQDYEFDKQTQLKSIPARIGVGAALRLAAVCHLGMILALAALPLSLPALPLGIIYWCGITAVALMLIYEHSVVRADDLGRVNVAFFNVNAIVSLGLFAVGTLDLLI